MKENQIESCWLKLTNDTKKASRGHLIKKRPGAVCLKLMCAHLINIKSFYFCEYFISKENSIGFRGFLIIEKQYLIARIFRSSHSQVLINILNGGKVYEIRFLGNLKKIFRTSFFLSTPESLLQDI